MAPLKGLVKRMKITPNQLPRIGKVGVVGVTVFQTTPIDSESANYQMLNNAGASHLADLLYAPVYPGAQPAYMSIQAAFTERGYQLLEPVQFLDSPKKQGYFANRQFEMSGLMQAVGHLQRRAKGNPQENVIGSVRGTREFGYLHADPKLWREVGHWVGDLGLDSALILETEVAIHRGKLLMAAIRGTLIGPNRILEQEAYKKFYAPLGTLKGRVEG